MSKTYRMGAVLLAVVTAIAVSDSKSLFGQRFGNRGNGGSNQGGSGNKNDKDDDDQKKKDKNNQGNSSGNQNGGQSGNQGGQSGSNSGNKNSGNQGNSGNSNQNNSGGNSNKSGNSGNSNNSGNSSNSAQIQQLIQRKKDQDKDKDKDKDKDRDKDRDRDKHDNDNQGQNGSNLIINGKNQGFPNNGKGPNSQVIIGGNPESANKKLGRWNGDKWDGTRKVDSWSRVFGVSAQPFSARWYDDHPSAWKYNNNRTNVWVVATVPGVYSWLNWGNVPPQYGTYRVERFDPTLYGEYYPLGVFSLMTGEEDPGTRVVQLAVDRRGNITGNYFDMITSANNSILGNVDRDSQRVEFWLNRNPSVRFRSNIARLLQPYGSLSVQLPGGDQRWQFVRLENE